VQDGGGFVGPGQVALGILGQPVMAILQCFLASVIPAEPLLTGPLHAEAEGKVAAGKQPLGQCLGKDRFHAPDGASTGSVRQWRERREVG
jgi:hypothetical protein